MNHNNYQVTVNIHGTYINKICDKPVKGAMDLEPLGVAVLVEA